MSKFKILKVLMTATIFFFFIFTFSFISACKETVPAKEVEEALEKEVKEEVAEPEEEVEELGEEPEPEEEPEEVEIEVVTGASIVGSCETYGPARHVKIEGDYAYVTDVKGLRIINISDKENPRIIGNCETPGFAMGIYLEGNYTYIADWDKGGLQIIDISDKENPFIFGNCDTPGEAAGVFIEENYAYIADRDSGLCIIDISDKDKEDPCIVGGCDIIHGAAMGIYVEENYAYIAVVDGGLLDIIDISNKENPYKVGSCGKPGKGQCVYVEGNYAYIADVGTILGGEELGDGMLHIVDISDKENPYIAGTCDTPDDAESVYVEGDYAYVSNYKSGLIIIELLKSIEILKLQEKG